MVIHQHVLLGCAPAPLAHYLKALGILRLVSEQKDPLCRGAWRDDHFAIATQLTRNELERFFLDEYEPTALVSPWNKGSGFFVDHDRGLHPIEGSSAQRLRRFRDGIAAARSLLAELAVADAEVRGLKDEAKKLPKAKREARRKDPEYRGRLAAAERKFKSLKATFIPECRLAWRGSHLDWMNSAMTLGDDAEPMYPALLGTGGNDGRLDFTNNFMQRLGELFEFGSGDLSPKPYAAERLAHALWREAAVGVAMDTAIGQYLPGCAGGANSSTGAEGSPQVNPWDFLLMFEGAIVFTPAVTKRLGTGVQVQASAPFALRGQAAGGATFEATEESARGEQWLPIWPGLASLGELRKLLEEGRAQVGRSNAARPIDMARAIGRLGVARGVTSFQRYAFLERNGQSNFAVPLERIPVGHLPASRLVDDLASWLDRLTRTARDAVPARLAQAERRLSDAVFAALTHDQNPALWQSILIAAAEVEEVQASGLALRVGPIPRLSPEWLSVCDDQSPEFRLAAVLGSAGSEYTAKGRHGGPVRHHWLPLKQWGHSYAAEDRMAGDPRVVATNRDPLGDLMAVLSRRYVESQQSAGRHPQLSSHSPAHLSDLALWVEGAVDARRCVTLARALMAVDWTRWDSSEHPISKPQGRRYPDDGWMALRLCCLPEPVDSKHDIPFDPQILRWLEGGRVDEAFRVARQRLQAHGIYPTLRHVVADPAHAKWWGAALALPISQLTAKRLVRMVQPEAPKE